MTEPIPCDIEHVTDFDETACILVRREEGQGVIEIRGLENIVILRFNCGDWDDLVQDAEDVQGELLDAE